MSLEMDIKILETPKINFESSKKKSLIEHSYKLQIN